MNAAFKAGLEALGWEERRYTFWATDEERLLPGIYGRPAYEQKAAIEEAGHEPIMSYSQTEA